MILIYHMTKKFPFRKRDGLKAGVLYNMLFYFCSPCGHQHVRGPVVNPMVVNPAAGCNMPNAPNPNMPGHYLISL